MDTEDYLYYGLKINSVECKEDVERLAAEIQAMPDDPEKAKLQQAIRNYYSGFRKAQTPEVRDALIKLTQGWYRMDEKYRDSYKALLSDPEVLEARLLTESKTVQKFHNSLVAFVGCADTHTVIEGLFRVHELDLQLRKYVRMQDWPHFRSSPTTW